jgi:hypothetical protein
MRNGCLCCTCVGQLLQRDGAIEVIDWQACAIVRTSRLTSLDCLMAQLVATRPVKEKTNEKGGGAGSIVCLPQKPFDSPWVAWTLMMICGMSSWPV